MTFQPFAYADVTIADSGTTSSEADFGGLTPVGMIVGSGTEGTTFTFTTSHPGHADIPVTSPTNTNNYTVDVDATSAKKYKALDPYAFLGLENAKVVAASQTGATTITFVLANIKNV